MTMHVICFIRTVPQCDVLKMFVAFGLWFINFDMSEWNLEFLMKVTMVAMTWLCVALINMPVMSVWFNMVMQSKHVLHNLTALTYSQIHTLTQKNMYILF